MNKNFINLKDIRQTVIKHVYTHVHADLILVITFLFQINDSKSIFWCNIFD